MYQSIPSLTIPSGNPLGNFLKGQIPHPTGHKESAKTLPPWEIIFKNTAKNPTKNETEIMKVLKVLNYEVLKQ